MSVYVSSLVWQFSKASGSTLLTALALADRSDDEGKAYPSVASLAKKARVSERSVQYALSQLRDFGELVVKVGAGPHGCNLYQLQVQNLRGAEIAPGVQPGASGGEAGCTRYVSDTSIEKKGDTRVKLPPAPKASAPVPPVQVDLPDWMPAAAWQGWVDMRAKAKDPVTANIAALAIKKLDKLRGQGHQPEDVLEQSTLSGWTGLFPVKGSWTPKAGAGAGESMRERRLRERHAASSGGLVSAADPGMPGPPMPPLSSLMPQRAALGGSDV